MSLKGLIGLFSSKPVHPVGDDGRMVLTDHFRELRARVLRSVLVLVVAFGASLFFYHQLYELVAHPYLRAQVALGSGRTEAYTQGVGGPFSLYLKLCGFAALIVTAPFWLYQIWAFIMPGLLPREKKWALGFVGTAGPLFLIGVAVAYFVLPKGVEVLISVNPGGMKNLVEFNDYLSFFLHTMLIFGIAFEVPVFVVALNVVGVLPATALKRLRPWIIVGIFVFAGAATPTTDPFTMLAMAVPMCMLYGGGEAFAHVHDRRKAARGINAGLDPDTPSVL